jgi:uncharacterized protein (TIGR03000 family)
MRRLSSWLIVLLLAGLWLSGPGFGQEKKEAEKKGEVKAEPKPTQVRVLLPQDNATLTIEGSPTKQTGASRLFVTPALAPGKKYSYKLVAIWEPNNYTKITRTKEVTFDAGQEIEVDFRQKDDRFPDAIKVRYVPTPQDVVEEMCKLGNVTKGDIVYDLGCGDGRLVITAVEQFGAVRGVGVDIDPERIAECKANAKKSTVGDKVQFRQQDVLKIADISDATIVLLYMGEDLNIALRPILQKSLKPGSRVVSHRFTMGDWKPLKTINYTGKDGDTYNLHLWIIGQDSKEKE